MTVNEPIRLNRNVKAYLVPSGEKITLLKGELATITQDLGGSYTVYINGNMVKLDGVDADALGFDPTPEIKPQDHGHAAGTADEQQVWEQLKTCYDPEIPVNIVDLGLIYDCSYNKIEGKGVRVEIKMTLTAPGCGMGGIIAEEVDRKIRVLPGIFDVNVELVWEPLWNREMMSEAAQLQLGLM
ncbi:MAG: putative Fe-S cluster assembly protein SufT [Candidatus Neomarinimicrobiota bacterium]